MSQGEKVVRMEEHAQVWILFSKQTMQTNIFDMKTFWALGCIHCCSQPRTVLGASGAYLTSGYYVLLALDHSLCVVRGCFHAALLLSVSSRRGRGEVECIEFAHHDVEKELSKTPEQNVRDLQNSDVGGQIRQMCMCFYMHTLCSI